MKCLPITCRDSQSPPTYRAAARTAHIAESVESAVRGENVARTLAILRGIKPRDEMISQRPSTGRITTESSLPM